MTILKRTMMIALTTFLVASTIGIIAVLYENVSFPKNEIFLSCDLGSKNFFTLIIDKAEKKVHWRGRKENKDKDRYVKNFTDTEIQIRWQNEKDMDVDFAINRLDGTFKISLLKPDKIDKSANYPKDYFKINRGNCYEKQQKY
jgi:hypothetical protein